VEQDDMARHFRQHSPLQLLMMPEFKNLSFGLENGTGVD
jgi:hypothetical protein